ncbi:hypothetical protein B1J92_E02475g [Nakaseomyces glabratus]|nr:hypothetical protein B1J91_E02475g [Nakaseomyces glabratus]OXB49635.1 hypothetical protein B1J92_E02475g [Nakaseomyces glabratus]
MSNQQGSVNHAIGSGAAETVNVTQNATSNVGINDNQKIDGNAESSNSINNTSNNNNNNNERIILPSFSSLKTEDNRIDTSMNPIGPKSITTSSSTPASVGFSVASLDNPLPPATKKPEIKLHPLPQQQQPRIYTQQQPQQQQILQQDQQEILQNQRQGSTGASETSTTQSPLVSGPAQTQGDPMSYRPLNVKDALSYLEQVKFQFHTRPDIYNLFLDIMKDFKSQTIDTPGVIERVSSLFKGYPNLIQGFNTFLPQGYRIECSNNPNDPIKVTTPMGSSTTVLNTAPQKSPSPSDIQTNNQQTQAIAQEAQLQSQATPIPTQHDVGQNFGSAKKPADVEFSQAITYVNKIKTRFADQPDIYKQFLEILQTYQREQKPIHEVYAQVTILFQNAPDLLDDFKKFLPDSSASGSEETQVQQQQHYQSLSDKMGGNAEAANYAASGMNAQTGYYEPVKGGVSYNTQQNQHQQQNLPPIGSFSPPTNGPFVDQTQQSANPETQKGVMSLPSMMNNAEAVKEQAIKQAHSRLISDSHDHNSQQQVLSQNIHSNDDIPVSNLRTTVVEQNYHPETIYQQQGNAQQHMVDGGYVGTPSELVVRPEIDLDPSLVPVVPEPTEPIENSLNLMEETNFFERVKKSIGNKQIYNEFLKILNLFSLDLLTVDELVDKVEYYIGANKELFDWFKVFVGYQDKPKRIENIVHEKHKLDLDLCEAYGPSYKKLPKTDTFMPCSGRDDMCWEVLNDEWVGHPVWASEDSGFIAHRKNQYEETLFKIEEERHEYDYYIESNLRTIQTLETIANKIANMTDAEKAQFRLPPGLGHTSMTIYKKVIRKVYDKERGFEIIDALHNYPAISVPIILRRLKQKDEEWRRAQREWNKIWRDLEQKVYFKSLDHLGLTFKQADKKLLTTKQLISEINGIKVDQNSKRIHWLTPKPKNQLDYDFPDYDILFDIIALGFVFTINTNLYSNPDKERIKDMLRVFVSQFFSIPLKEVSDALERRGFSDDNNNDSDKGSGKMDQIAEEIGETEQDTSSSKKRPFDNDLNMSDILHKTKQQKTKMNKEMDGSKSASEDLGTDRNVGTIEDSGSLSEHRKQWLVGDVVDSANKETPMDNRNIYNLFANTNIYIFFRHLVTLYERLSEVKQINDEINKEIKSRRVTTFAKDLGLISTQLSELGLDFNSSDAYQQLLTLSKRLIEGDIEHQWFEESIRQAYNNRAFKLYTIDKVVQSFVKHAHTLISDSKTSEIMLLFENQRNNTLTTTKDQILYRIQCRSHMSSTENMFRIEYKREKRHASIQYIALDDLTLKTAKSPEEAWNYYVTSYSLSNPTEGVPHENLEVPFLEKVIEFDQEYSKDNGNNSTYSLAGISKSNLHIDIDREKYNLILQGGSSDVYSRATIQKYPIVASDESRAANISEKTQEIRKVLSHYDGNSNDDVNEKFNYILANGTIDGYVRQSAAVVQETEKTYNDDSGRNTSSIKSIIGSATERTEKPLINGSPIID